MPVSKARLVLVFGCSRSGTTYMQHLLAVGEGYACVRVLERCKLSIYNSADGLFNIMEVCQHQPGSCILVRTKRHPLDIAESWWAERQATGTPVGSGEELAYAANRATNIRTEHRNATHLRAMTTDAEWPLAEISYEELDDKQRRKWFWGWLATHLPDGELNADMIVARHQAAWRKVPARAGKLSRRITEAVMPAHIREQLAIELKEVIEAEGYE